MGQGKSGQTIGYKYFLGIDFKWCHAPVDAFRKFYVGDRVVWEGSKNTGDITINADEIFGEFEGGVSGTLEILDGNPAQLQNDYLVNKIGTGVPAYRGVASTIHKQMYLGNNPYLKAWTSEITRIKWRLMNGTVIPQWQQNYSAVPLWQDTSDNYSGITVQPQQILIQIDLSSYSNGFKNNFLNTAGAGQDIEDTKAAVNTLLTHIRDYSNWTAGDLDIAVAYFRHSDSATVSTDDNPANYSPDNLITDFPSLPKRGVNAKVGATKADITDLISYVTGLTVFPDTSTTRDAALAADNATDFFSAVGTDKYRLSMIFSTFDFTTGADQSSQTISTLLSAGDNGLGIGGKYAYYPIGQADLTGPNLFSGFNSFTEIASMPIPTGWVSLIDCQRPDTGSAVFGKEFGPEFLDGGSMAFACANPTGWTTTPQSYGAVVPSTANYVVYLQQWLPATLYHPYYITRQGFYRTSGGANWQETYTNPDGTTDTSVRYLPVVSDSAVGPTNSNLTNLINTLYYLGGSAGKEMNPAHIIRECLTDQQWGLGIPESEVDETSFLASAITLYNEKFGLSFNWNRQTEVEEFIKVVLNHIDAMLYVRRDTGLWTLKLVRDDYDPDLIPVFTDDDVVAWEQITRKSEAELVNSVTVKFNDRKLRGPASLTVNNLAQVQQLGVVIPATVQYAGVWQQQLASLIASRDLRSLSSATISGSIRVTRKGATLYPADTFKLDSARYGLGGEVMRVVEVNVGDGKDNSVYIKFVQDVFALGSVPVTGSPDSEWSDILNQAQPVTNRVVEEENYRNFVRRNGEQIAAELLAFEPNLGYLSATGEAPTSDSLNARNKYDAGAGYLSGGITDFSPTATLAVDVTKSPLDSTWTFTTSFDLSTIAVNSLAIVGSEFVNVLSINTTTNTIVVGRGCIDTVPIEHITGTKIYFLKNGLSTQAATQFVSTDVVSLKLLTNAGYGQLPAELAPVNNLTFASRIARPYPVADLKVNGGYDDTLYAGTLNFSWKHRDKTLQTGAVAEDYLAASIGPEAGVAYTFKADRYSDTGAFVANVLTTTVTGTTSYSFDTTSYPITGTGFVKFYVVVSKDGLDNWTNATLESYLPATGSGELSRSVLLDANLISTLFQIENGTVPVTTNDDPVGFIDNQNGAIL